MDTSGGGGWEVQRADNGPTQVVNPARPGPARTESTSSGLPIQLPPQPSTPQSAPPPSDTAPQDIAPAQPDTAPSTQPAQPSPSQPDPVQPAPPDPNQPTTTGGGE